MSRSRSATSARSAAKSPRAGSARGASFEWNVWLNHDTCAFWSIDGKDWSESPAEARGTVQANGGGRHVSRLSVRRDGVEGYLDNATDTVSLIVQIESVAAVERVEAIVASGVDAIFVGPSDLAASMGLLGQQEHPDVVAAVEHCIAVARGVGLPVGVNAFSPATAERYLGAGAVFILVGADVALLARGSEELATRFIVGRASDDRSSY